MSDRVGRRRPTSTNSIDSRLGLVSRSGDGPRQDKERAKGDALDLDGDAGQAERVLHPRHGEDGENAPRDRARPAEDVDATQQDDGGDREGHALGRIGSGTRQARGQDDSGQRRDQPGQDEQADLDPGHPNTRVAGRPGVLADGVNLTPYPGPMEDDAQQAGQDDEDDKRPWDQRPWYVSEDQLSECG